MIGSSVRWLGAHEIAERVRERELDPQAVIAAHLNAIDRYDGRIHAYEPQANGTFEPAGALRRQSGSVITIDGLWAIEFGNGGAAGQTNSLFFTAGPDDESHGLFGSLTAGTRSS